MEERETSHSPEIDAYLKAASPVFAEMMAHLREAVHRVCPGVDERLRWGAPSFGYRGKILCGMAAFKQHMAFGFWQHVEVKGSDAGNVGMGSYGKMRGPDDLPPRKVLEADIRKAMKLIDAAASGTARPARKTPRTPRAAAEMPADFEAALSASSAARAHFDAFPPGQRREYVEWIAEAKREDTRARRIAQAVEWLGEGKRRNWKYENC